MKADLDSYILMSNLSLYLSRFDPRVPHYMGKQLMTTEEFQIFVMGPAVIFSIAAFEIMARTLIDNRHQSRVLESLGFSIPYLGFSIHCDDLHADGAFLVSVCCLRNSSMFLEEIH